MTLRRFQLLALALVLAFFQTANGAEEAVETAEPQQTAEMVEMAEPAETADGRQQMAEDRPRERGRGGPERAPDRGPGGPPNRGPGGPPERGPGAMGPNRGPDQPDSPSIPLEERRVRFNFRAAMWKDVIEWLAEQADLSLMMKTYPQGTFNYREEQYFTPDEAIDKLNQYLMLEEFVLIRMDKMLVVRDLGPGSGNIIPPEMLQTVFPEDLAKRGSFEVVRCQFVLKRTTPDIVQIEIERILGPLSAVAIMPQSQTIIITDTVSNLRAIQKTINLLDSVEQSGTFKFYELKNITAEEAITMMRNLMGLIPEDQTLRVMADMSGKKIWLNGRADRIEKAIEMLTKIDEAYVETIGHLGELQFKVFPVDTADLATVLAVCQTLLAGKPGVRLSIDQNTNSLIARAYLDDLMVIKNTLASMQTDAYGNHVIRLSKMTTANASTAIEKFFGKDSGSSARAPVVETDATNKCLYVRCTSSQLTQIRSLLTTMGETFDAVPNRENNTKTIRNINISPSAAALIIDQIQQVWPQGHGNEIKVVTPSGIVGAMRDNSDGRRQTADGRQQTADGRVPVMPNFGPPPPADRIDQEIDDLFGPPLDLDTIPNPSTRNSVPKATYHPIQRTRVVDDEPELTPAQQALQDMLQEQLRQEMQSKPNQPEGLTADALAYLQGVNPNKGAPVVLSIGPAGLMVASEDTEALDALEALIEALSNEAVLTTPILKPYYLQYVSADTASSTLRSLLGTSSSSTSPAIEDMGNAMLLSYGGGLGPIQATGEVSISTDTRLNAIYVSANPVDHYTIEKKLLPLLDRGESEEEIKITSTPRTIQLKYMKAKDAMEQVKTVFASQMQGQQGANNRGGPGGAGGQGQPGGPPQMPGIDPNMIQQFMQRMQQQGGRGGQATREEEEKMTLSTIDASNILVVSAPEVLFKRVKEFVEILDEATGELDIVTEFVDVKNVNPQMLRTMIGNIVGADMITSSGTTSQPRGATSSLTTGTTVGTGVTGATGARPGGGFGGFGGPGGGGGGFGGPGGGGPSPFGGIMNLFQGGQRPGGAGGAPAFAAPGGGGGGGAQQRPGGATPGGAAGRGGR